MNVESTSPAGDRCATDVPTAGDPCSPVIGVAPESSDQRDNTVGWSEQSAANPATARPKIGRYEILGEIARGGMGVVYKAADRQLDRLIALKLIKSGELADADEIERFQTEAKAAAQLDHPGIVQVYEVGQIGPQHFMAMAFIDGHSLWHEVKESPLAPERAAKLMQQVAEAVHYAHERRIVHRDLKPQNILLTKDGQPKVTDFGLAKRQESDSSLTETGQALGTPSYMPPEQAQGKVKQVGSLADVYSLGATLYCLLTGRPPFQAATKLETMLQVVEQEPVSPRQLNTAVPRDLETICLKALQKEQPKRYSSSAEFAADLGRFLRDEPIVARPVGPSERFLRWCRRNPVVTGALTLAALLLVAVATVSTAAYLREVRLVGEKDQLIRDKDGLITEKDGLISSVELARTKADDHARRATANEILAKDRAEQLKVKTDELSSELYISKITRGAAELEIHDYAAAERTLASIPWEQRGWEYRYLWRQCEGTALTLRGHRGQVLSIAFSPNDMRLASGSDDQTVKLWDATTGAELETLRGHTDRVTCVTFSPDGKRLASSSYDQTVKLWDVASGQEIQTLRSQSSGLTCVAFSPDGRRLASASNGQTPRQTIVLWDAATGTELQTLPGNGGMVNSVAFSPDGKLLAGTCGDQTIKLWDTMSGNEVKTLPRHALLFTSVAFTPDGKRLASAYDRTIKIWDSTTGAELQILHGHSAALMSVTYSADGMQLASASQDNTIKLWDAATGTELQTLSGHNTWVHSVAFSPDGMRLASASGDYTIKLWDVVSRAERQSLSGHSNTVNSVAFNRDGTQLASTSQDQTIKLWDTTTGAEIRTLHWQTNGIRSVAFSPDAIRLACGAVFDQAIKLWDVATGNELQTLHGHSKGVNSVVFSLNGTRLASGSDDQTVKLWDATTGAELETLRGHTDRVTCVTFSPDGKRLASGAWDKAIKLWDAETGAELHTLQGHGHGCLSVAFSPDGTRLASGSFDNTLKLWDASTGQELQTLCGHTSTVNSVAFSPDGTRLVSASTDKMLKVWDAMTGAELQTLRGHAAYVTTVAFSPTGTQLASGSFDRTIKLWDAAVGAELYILRGHQRPVLSIAFTWDGARLISRDLEGNSLVWQLPNGELLEEAPVPDASQLTEDCRDPLIQAVSHGAEIHLIHKNPKYDPWKEDAERRRKLSSKWHAEQAAKAEASENWYAAAFHRGCERSLRSSHR